MEAGSIGQTLTRSAYRCMQLRRDLAASGCPMMTGADADAAEEILHKIAPQE
jgi:hypothetical protein